MRLFYQHEYELSLRPFQPRRVEQVGQPARDAMRRKPDGKAGRIGSQSRAPADGAVDGAHGAAMLLIAKDDSAKDVKEARACLPRTVAALMRSAQRM